MIKRCIVFFIIFITFTNIVHARQYGYSSNKSSNFDFIKFGVGTGFSYQQIVKRRDYDSKIGIIPTLPIVGFAEYRFATYWIGLRVMLNYSIGLVSKTPKVLSPLDCFIVDFPVRFYPGSGRQFCLFIGPNITYIINIGQGRRKVAKKKIKKTTFGIMLGLDYEFKVGLSLGFTGRSSFYSVVKNKDKIIHGGILYLFYNFATLL